jgi:hypothetical protein
MNFINKYVQTMISFIGTNGVLSNGIIGWKVWFVINHQLIHKVTKMIC